MNWRKVNQLEKLQTSRQMTLQVSQWQWDAKQVDGFGRCLGTRTRGDPAGAARCAVVAVAASRAAGRAV